MTFPEATLQYLTGHTATGDSAGTLMFMPRQQVMDFRYSSPAVDVWAVAASYYYMLTGEYPKDFVNKDQVLAALDNAAIPIQKRDPKIPQRIAQIIDQALIDNPVIGIQSASDLKLRIERAL